MIDMAIRALNLLILLVVMAGHASAAPFWDLALGVEHDDNWNRAAQQSGQRDDTIYQLGVKYGYSQGLSPLSGMLYSVELAQHQWQHYKALDNTQLTANLSYQKRLSPLFQAPWVSLNMAVAYADYKDSNRQSNQYEASADIGQDFRHWQYQGRIGWKQNSAKADVFSTESRFITLGGAIKASQALTFAVDVGFERGDVISSMAAVPASLQYSARARDDALGYLNWQAYRFDADSLWKAISVSYGWHGKHELSANVKGYDTDAEGLSYSGRQWGLSYVHLF